MGVREGKQRKEGESLPATGAATATDADPVVVFIVGLLAAPMTDDGIAITNRASSQDDIATARRKCTAYGQDGLLVFPDRLLEGIAPDVLDLGQPYCWGPNNAEAPPEPSIVK